MAFGLSTGTMFSPMYRNPLQSNAESGLFTADYEAKSQVGPTRENLAKKQHAEDIKNLSAEIAAKETPQAKKDLEDFGESTKSAQEKELERMKKDLQKKIEDCALEEAVKKDKYFLIKNEWDRKVIMAANGETVTVEYEDTKSPKGPDGTYPVKVLTITKSSKLKKISDTRTTSTYKSPQSDYFKKREALQAKYKEGFKDSKGNFHNVEFLSTGKFIGSPIAIEQYKVEEQKLKEDLEREKVAAKARAQAVPEPQGLNVEPHTIAIYAPGFCMNEGCCLELAYYTLRAAAKTIEDDAEALVESDLKDVIAENKALHDELEAMTKEHRDMYSEALKEAGKLASETYKEDYKKYITVTTGPDGKPQRGGPKPDPVDYTAEVFLDNTPELLYDYNDYGVALYDKEEEVSLSDAELAEERIRSKERLTQDAFNYRLLIDKCSFQPTCPEWLEDIGTGIADAAKKTGEAIVDAAEWCWDGISSATDWVAEGGIERTIDTVNGYINDGLAYMSDLQTSLNQYIGFEGLCSLNPFGGTLGCANCPMGSQCSSTKSSLLDKLNVASQTNEFLKNLKGALGLGKGQLLGNLLQCAAALTGQVSGAINAVENFAIGTGAAKILGNTTSILNTSALPNWNTKVADCIGCSKTLDQAEDALNLINNTGKNPMSVMSSNAPGLNSSVLDLSKLDNINAGSDHFSNKVLGTDKLSSIKTAQNYLPVEAPKGSTKYYDGKNVDVDSATKRTKQDMAAGVLPA